MMKNGFYLIRIAQIFFKFGIILFIPNLLGHADLANYGYINAVVNIFIILYGFELWYFYNRDTAKKESTEKIFINQYSNYLFLYILFVPVLYFLMMDFNITIIFMVIAFSIISHFVQEVVRSLIHLGELTESAIVNIMQSSWVIAFLIIHKSSLEYVLSCMLLGSVLSLLLGIYFIKQLDIKKLFKLDSFDLHRFINDLKKVARYFVSSLCMRLALSAPILLFKHINSEDSLVVYSYYFALAMGMEFFIYHFIQARFISRLVFNNANDENEYLKDKRTYFVQNTFFIALSLIGSYVFCGLLLPFLITNEVILGGFYYGGCILLSVAIMNFSNYYAIVLYSQHNDRSNIYAPPISFILALALTLVYYIITGNTNRIGYIYILMFSIILLITRYIYWVKFDRYEKKSCFY